MTEEIKATEVEFDEDENEGTYAFNLHFLTDSSEETYRTIVKLASKYFGDDLGTEYEDTKNYTEYSIYAENHTEEEFEKFAEELSKQIKIKDDWIEDVSY